MPSIKTIVKDIYALFDPRTKIDVEDSVGEEFGKKLGLHILRRIREERTKPSLRMSNLGMPDRKLWYTVNTPELAEPLQPQVRIKFLYGDLLEELLLFLSQLAGHKVEGQQDEVQLNGVKGRRDAIIDGHLVDAKSASSYSFRKFKDHTLKEDGNDSFGYIPQLDGYLHSSLNDVRLLDKDKASFLAINKESGEITLDTYRKGKVDYTTLIDRKRQMLAHNQPPERCYEDEPEGQSGNRKLGVVCSYCPFKHTCWPGVRTFLYSNKPVFLTHVAKRPQERIIEVQRTA